MTTGVINHVLVSNPLKVGRTRLAPDKDYISIRYGTLFKDEENFGIKYFSFDNNNCVPLSLPNT